MHLDGKEKKSDLNFCCQRRERERDRIGSAAKCKKEKKKTIG